MYIHSWVIHTMYVQLYIFYLYFLDNTFLIIFLPLTPYQIEYKISTFCGELPSCYKSDY